MAVKGAILIYCSDSGTLMYGSEGSHSGSVSSSIFTVNWQQSQTSHSSKLTQNHAERETQINNDRDILEPALQTLIIV